MSASLFKAIKSGYAFPKLYFLQRNISNGRNLPKILYFQNPFAWLTNKFEFRTIQKTIDPTFNFNEFEHGSKKAMSVISQLISQNAWIKLQGLMSDGAIKNLQKEVETTWTDEKRRHIGFDVTDINIAIPRRVLIRKVLGDDLVDIDMIFVVLKFKEEDPSPVKDVVFIELISKFTRLYTSTDVSYWTISKCIIKRFDLVQR